MTRVALYRFFDADDVLLYIGTTDNITQRWRAHRTRTTWWDQVAREAVEWFDNRTAAEAAEKAAIAAEEPLHNIHHGRAKPRAYESRTAFWEYARSNATCHGSAAIAKRMGGVTPSEVNRWFSQAPEHATAIAFARTFSVDPVEALVAAGHLTPKEATKRAPSLDAYTDDELLAEVRRRMKR